jgi:ubiquitin conjugation factor E4 B
VHVEWQLSIFLQLFASAANILWKIGGDLQIIQEFTQLAGKVKAAAAVALDAEAVLGDIPDEFLDPIQVSVNLLFTAI